LIDAAASASGAVVYLPGYDGTVSLAGLALVIGRLVLALYLVASALAGFDHRKLSAGEIGIRLALAVLLIAKHDFIYIGAAIAAVAVIAHHVTRRPATA